MRVRDVMASPVVTVAPGAALKEVASLLVERRINAVPVVDAGDRLIGIVSEADLLSLETGQVAAAGGAPPHSAGEVMRQSVYTLTGDTDATAAARLMLRHRLKSIPVVDGDRVVGMVTRRDLLRLIARSDEDIRADLERRVAEELEALRQAAVEVRDGVVTVDADGPCRQLVEQLARTVPGVVEVRSRRPDPAP
ncbi:MAG TPA: CBS domain-containing protein [Actinomycetes bacterium]|nr:CBS domain-containing protein [Actinomycetes bacterium]